MGLACELEVGISALSEGLNRFESPLRVAAYALVVLDGEVGEEVVEPIDVSIPLNLFLDLVDCVVEADLASAEVLDPIGVHGQASEWSHSDVLEIPRP
jgi:hypothetical protein